MNNFTDKTVSALVNYEQGAIRIVRDNLKGGGRHSGSFWLEMRNNYYLCPTVPIRP